MDNSHVVSDQQGLTVAYPEQHLSLRLSNFRDSRSDGPSAELTVSKIDDKGLAKVITHGKMALSKFDTRERMAKRLTTVCGGPKWNDIIEHLCRIGVQYLREGEPIELLTPTEHDQPAAFILNPILYQHQPVLLYGPGDSGKSMLCLYLAMLLAKGGSENNLAASPHTVLYLDWELNSQVMRSRVKQLRAGHPNLTVDVRYRRCYHPLADELDSLQREIKKGDDIDVLVVDSLAMAAGAELERAETAIRFFSALRTLGKAALVIGHVAKNAETRSIYGSVFFYNLARSVWEVRRDDSNGSHAYRMGLYHRKCNLGPRHTPLGFEVAMDGDKATIQSIEIDNDPALMAGMGMTDQIKALMKTSKPLTAQEIADTLGVQAIAVRPVLSRYKGKLWAKATGASEKDSVWYTL